MGYILYEAMRYTECLKCVLWIAQLEAHFDMHIIRISIQQYKSIQDKRVVLRMKKESYYLEQMYYMSLLRAESIEMLLSTNSTIKVHTNMHF